jgi:hypothetical protein
VTAAEKWLSEPVESFQPARTSEAPTGAGR